jgi:hypothetical protein
MGGMAAEAEEEVAMSRLFQKSKLMEMTRFYIITLPLTSRLDKREDTRHGTNGRTQLFLD